MTSANIYIYEQLRPSTDIYIHLRRTSTNIDEHLRESMKPGGHPRTSTFMNIYQHPQTSAYIYEQLRKSQKRMLTINEHLRESMTIYGHPRKSVPTNIDEHPRTSTNIYEHLQTSMDIRENLYLPTSTSIHEHLQTSTNI